MNMATNNKTYLGDSVYYEFDGYYVQLYTDNGMGPHNQIALEPEVMLALFMALNKEGILENFLPKK